MVGVINAEEVEETVAVDVEITSEDATTEDPLGDGELVEVLGDGVFNRLEDELAEELTDALLEVLATADDALIAELDVRLVEMLFVNDFKELLVSEVKAGGFMLDGGNGMLFEKV